MNSREKVETLFSHYKPMGNLSEVQGQLTPQSVVRLGQFYFFFWEGGGGSSVAEGVRWGGGVGGAGVRVDVNAMLGVGVMWGMGDVNQE